MSQLQYTIVNQGDEANIMVVVPGDPKSPYAAHSSHSNFERIVAAVVAGDADPDEITPLFDIAETVATRFDRLSERVTVANGRVYFDGDEVDSSLTTQIVRFLNEGVEDWQPLVAFMENVQQNPNEHSREQLYDWLNAREFTITDEGHIVGYKGVAKDAEGNFVSIHSGSAIVDGQPVTGQIPNAAGSVIEMPRGDVHHDPATACSTGLHVGTYQYAQSYARNGAMLEVHVNPRDVVSVPTDGGGEKVRVCRYTVVDTIDAPYNTAYVPYEDEDCDECGEDCGGDCVVDEPEFKIGDRVTDYEGDPGTIIAVNDGEFVVEYDSLVYADTTWDASDLSKL